jgi:hypothetical protein
VNDDEKEHTDVVLEECAKKVCKDMFSNLRIQATNGYLKAHIVAAKSNLFLMGRPYFWRPGAAEKCIVSCSVHMTGLGCHCWC